MQTNLLLNKIGLNEEQYNQHIYDSGINYAEYYTRDTEAAKWITETKAYWSWYRNQFEQIDELFLLKFSEHPVNDRTVALLKKRWYNSHNAGNMVAYPNKAILERAWELMISAMNKEIAPEINELQSQLKR